MHIQVYGAWLPRISLFLMMEMGITNTIKRFFLNERLILCVIVLNAIILFLQESGIQNSITSTVDVSCTAIFFIEMIVKLQVFGLREYWSSGWNRLDGTLVVLSIPSLVALFLPNIEMNLSFLLVLRVLRVFRFFRLVHVFPGFNKLMKSFMMALRHSKAVFAAMFIMIVIFAMIGCALFKEVAPEYFSTPLEAIYTTFRIFTGEGWNEIPDTVSVEVGEAWAHAVKLYFSLLLIVGCVIGMSLLNSVFVDAMVADNDDDIREKLDSIEASLDEIKGKLANKQ